MRSIVKIAARCTLGMCRILRTRKSGLVAAHSKRAVFQPLQTIGTLSYFDRMSRNVAHS
jgi:hypothetical protein